MSKKELDPMEYAQFKFALIAPIVQKLFTESSVRAYCKRVTEKPLLLPNGEFKTFQPDTVAKWAWSYREGGFDALVRAPRVDKGGNRSLTAEAIAQIYFLREKYPKLNATMIYNMLVQDGFVDATTSVRTIQRFLRNYNIMGALNPHVRDRKAFEEAEFGRLWQSDTCYLPNITENGVSRRTYLVMIIDDCSRMIVGGEIFYNDSAENFQKVLKSAIEKYGIPDKLYLDNGSPYSNNQLSRICASVGIVEIHTPVRDGASKGKVERNFRTTKERWVYALDFSEIHSLDELNESLAKYIRQHNTTEHSAIGKTPLDRFMETREHMRAPKSQEWLDENFHNRIERRVRNDSCITIDNVTYDVPPQFIGMKVEVRHLPGNMGNAYILYNGEHFPIFCTDKVANCKAKRNNNYPTLRYGKEEVG